MAYLAGVDKVAFDQKLFGVYPLRSLVPGHALMGTQDDVFLCPQSRHAGLDDAAMEAQRSKDVCVYSPMESRWATPFLKQPISVS